MILLLYIQLMLYTCQVSHNYTSRLRSVSFLSSFLLKRGFWLHPLIMVCICSMLALASRTLLSRSRTLSRVDWIYSQTADIMNKQCVCVSVCVCVCVCVCVSVCVCVCSQ